MKYSKIILLNLCIIILVGSSLCVTNEDDNKNGKENDEIEEDYIYLLKILSPQNNTIVSGIINIEFENSNESIVSQQFIVDDNIIDNWSWLQNRIRPRNYSYDTKNLVNSQHKFAVKCFWGEFINPIEPKFNKTDFILLTIDN